MAFTSDRSFGALTILALLGLSACDPPETGKPVEHIAANKSAIINGQPDSTHDAVVAVLGQNFSCSGTIVQVKNGIGYVLTAAHCCNAGNPPIQIVMGQDYQQGTPHNVIQSSVTRDPCYGDCPGSTDDLCMLKFNAPAGTPVIPVMTPGGGPTGDNLSPGANLTYVGYGITSSPPAPSNSVRYYVTKPIATLDSYFISYGDPASSGTCEGDSGGPAIAVVNGVELVAGVTSYGDQACTQEGVSIRASTVYSGFIQPYLADTPPSPTCPKDTDCNVCFSFSTNPQCNGGCGPTVTACTQDAACAALINCYNGCGTQACQNTCTTQHIAGLQKYEAITACACETGCTSQCGSSGTCSQTRCGLVPNGASDTCDVCFEDHCCAEAWTCSQDSSCKACFSANPPASCATNANAQKFTQCATQSCSSSCKFKLPTTSGSTVATTTGATTVATTSTTSGAGGATAATTGAGSKGAGGAGGSGGTSSGCSCEMAGDGAPASLSLGLLAISLAGLSRRRRRR